MQRPLLHSDAARTSECCGVDSRKVSPGVIEPGFFECLQDRAFYMCLLADPMPHSLRPVPSLAEQFALCATELQIPTQPPLCQLIGHMAAMRDAALSHELPSALVGHDAGAWRLGPLSDFDDSLQFAKLVMNSYPSFKDTHGYVNHLIHWLESKEIERLAFNQMVEVVKREDPFAPWRQLGVERLERADPVGH